MRLVFSLLSRLSGCTATYYGASTSCVPTERDKSLSPEPEEVGVGGGGDDMVLIFANEITLGFVVR